MRILMIYIEPAPYILDLIRVLRQQNPDIQLRVLFISAGLSQPWETRLNDGVSWFLPEQRSLALKQIVVEIRQGHFDWLHLAGWGHPLLMAALIAGAMFRRRISMESDTQLPLGQSGWKKLIKKLLYPRLFSLAKLLLPGGTRQHHYFRHYGVPESKIRIARMTVDVAEIMNNVNSVRRDVSGVKRRWGVPESGLVFLYIGRLDGFKGGVNDLIDAFATMQERQDVYLVIAGDGDLRPVVEKAAVTIDRIVYLGRIDPQQVSNLYGICDVLVLPSHFDNWGLVINEAMAAGLPVIVSDRVGCVDDLVHHEKTGLVFLAHAVNELASAMHRLADDRLLRERMGEEGRKLISHWRLEDTAEILASAWQGVALR